MTTTVFCSEEKFQAVRSQFEEDHDCTVRVSNVDEQFRPMRVTFDSDSPEFDRHMVETFNR